VIEFKGRKNVEILWCEEEKHLMSEK
jgi:hypothetical protein